MARAKRTVLVGCPGGGGAVELPAATWDAIARLARRHGVAPARYHAPEEGLKLAAALRRGLARVGQLNREPYRAFSSPEPQGMLLLVIAFCEEGRGLAVVDRRLRA
jgi:hypothetical protein